VDFLIHHPSADRGTKVAPQSYHSVFGDKTAPELARKPRNVEPPSRIVEELWEAGHDVGHDIAVAGLKAAANLIAQ
jgi:hypothetical protein